MVRFYAWLGDCLSLYVRQVAWLNTAPKSSGKVSDRHDEPTRLERLQKAGERPLLPPNPAPYLTEWLFDVGPSGSNGMGETPIDYRDLVAWQDITGVELMPWEATTIRRLSRDFVAERHRAKEPACPAPYLDRDSVAAQRDDVAAKLKAAFGLRGKGR